MKYSKLLLVLMMVFSWFSLLFIGKKTIKRFFPAALFMAILVRVVNFIAEKRKWWWWYEKIHPSVSGSFPFVWGSFFVSSFWILKYTYGNFIKYLGLNLFTHSTFTYVLEPNLQKFGIASLVRMKKIELMYVFMVLAFLLYGFVLGKEKVLGKREVVN
ncbi:hypothetical protein AWH56_021990 [Anaerobacillus isosaccharinicus]|uniref:Uncharacterized protein n=1 Tax=Anaerobacillus isosaccharinicus TaxID=1532552 RepID=A0A1S2MFY8_9BACI|nr:hypothetical protein [Anaerobacillus isosaccharinicus]MBA5586424.1 hypothetical protein [Anaerobacillus isosaccharinicus]QOY35333.1 hypothetical protein AWH56_021990 [Anaerobacillus isosaccharinicus]